MNNLQISEKIDKLSTYDYWQKALDARVAIAIWHLPSQPIIEMVIDFSGNNAVQKLDLEESPRGFALGDFLNMAQTPQAQFIRADAYCTFDLEQQMVSEEIQPQILEQWQQFGKQNSLPKTTQRRLIFTENTPDSTETDFKKSVALAIEQIKEGAFQKVVLSRTKILELSPNFSETLAFQQLCNAYPDAFVAMVWLPSRQATWLGASPETLISIDENDVFRTIALAGTQAADCVNPSEARWSQKEIEEQALVSRYIVDCFKKIRLREFQENGPKTVIAGNLLHLRTDFMVETRAVNFPELATTMLGLLHPTSAVCGTPKNTALAFILNHEKYSRELYSGFWGPVGVANKHHLFVNLRAMKIAQQQATLYAGAGITADSCPEKEWIETEMKCQTLLSVL